MHLSNPQHDRFRVSGRDLGAERMARAAALVSSMRHASEQQDRMDAAVRASLGRVLRGIIKEELARANRGVA
jgi:hypothetical protein